MYKMWTDTNQMYKMWTDTNQEFGQLFIAPSR